MVLKKKEKRRRGLLSVQFNFPIKVELHRTLAMGLDAGQFMAPLMRHAILPHGALFLAEQDAEIRVMPGEPAQGAVLEGDLHATIHGVVLPVSWHHGWSILHVQLHAIKNAIVH